MEFERNFTENSDQNHVELRVKERWGCFRVSWGGGFTRVSISSFGIISPGINIRNFESLLSCFIGFDIALCKKPRIRR